MSIQPHTLASPASTDLADRHGGLLAWQRRGYPHFHATRRNLMLHIVTVPLFWLGSLAVVLGGVVDVRAVVAGVVACAVAVVVQGRGHAGEPQAPIPFRHAGDAVARIICEQWITWPRFVLSGGLREAWRTAR